MSKSTPIKQLSRRLVTISVIVAIVAVAVSWLSLEATQNVSARTDNLVTEYIPQLRSIGALQDAASHRVRKLYLYYATMDPGLMQMSRDERGNVDLDLQVLSEAELPAGENEALIGAMRGLDESTQRFHAEMDKGRDRNWDTLRDHLAEAQVAADTVDAVLSSWAERIRVRVGEGGSQTMEEVSRLDRTQIGFSAAILVIAMFLLTTLRARLKDQAELYQRAYFDRLTGLPNRRRLEEDWRERAPGEAQHSALILVQLDRYRLLMGTFGQSLVDEVVASVVTRVQNAIAIQQHTATLYQFAPATWLVLLEDEASFAGSRLLADMILRTSLKPLQLLERELLVTCDIGVARYPEHGTAISELIGDAETALRDAQASNVAHCVSYDPVMRKRTEEFLLTESAMRDDLHHGKFELFFQPKFSATDLTCSGAEALIRWRRDTGLVSPGLFIPVAEETGFIMQLGKWVIEEACRQWREWSDQNLLQLPIAVNVSAQQFNSAGFVAQVASEMRKHSVPPGMLELEITEEATFGNPEDVVHTLHDLKSIGVDLAIDDFGTGYSSFAYLKSFPVDVLKIDQTFIREMDNSPRDLSIVKMIVVLAKKLEFEVVAEGVETQAQQERLQEIGCDFLQGFLYSRPLPANEFREFLVRDRRSEVDQSNEDLAGLSVRR